MVFSLICESIGVLTWRGLCAAGRGGFAAIIVFPGARDMMLIAALAIAFVWTAFGPKQPVMQGSTGRRRTYIVVRPLSLSRRGTMS